MLDDFSHILLTEGQVSVAAFDVVISFGKKQYTIFCKKICR